MYDTYPTVIHIIKHTLPSKQKKLEIEKQPIADGSDAS